MTLARRIRDCRYAKGWGPDELAGRAKISRTALYQIECGKTETPRAATLNRIAKALGVSIEILLGSDRMAWDGASIQDGYASASSAAPGVSALADAEMLFELDAIDSLEANSSRMVPVSAARQHEIERKFRELMRSPLAEGLVRLVEASYRLLPTAAERSAV